MKTFRDLFDIALASEGLAPSPKGIIRVAKKEKIEHPKSDGNFPPIGEVYDLCPSCEGLRTVTLHLSKSYVRARCDDCKHEEIVMRPKA